MPIWQTPTGEKQTTKIRRDMGPMLLVLFLGVLYFLPTIIAGGRSHHNLAAIIALNLLLGWTILGWIGAVVWSLTVVRAPIDAI